MVKKILWIVVFVVFTSFPGAVLYSQDYNKEYVIDPLVGKEIDRAERDKYHLFPEIQDFLCASAYKIHNNRYYLAVTVRDEKTGLERSTLLLRDKRAIQKIHLQIESIGRILNTSTLPPGGMTKEEKKALKDKVGATRGLLQYPKRFFILNGTYLTGIGSDRTEWKSAYSMGAYSYYSLSERIALGYKFAFTQCTVNDKYNIIPAMDREIRADLSKYLFDTASGTRSIIEIMPSIRIAARRTRNTLLSWQFSAGLYMLRRSDYVIKGYYKQNNMKSVLTIASGAWTKYVTAYNYYYHDQYTSKQLALSCVDYADDNMGIRGSMPAFAVGLSYNIRNFVDIQPTFTFVSHDPVDLFKVKNCYLSLTLSLIIPEEIIVNPLKPVPLN